MSTEKQTKYLEYRKIIEELEYSISICALKEIHLKAYNLFESEYNRGLDEMNIVLNESETRKIVFELVLEKTKQILNTLREDALQEASDFLIDNKL